MRVTGQTFCTVFPAYKDFHFYKDPGQIPFRFSRRGYNSLVVTLADDADLKASRSNLSIITIKNTFLSRKFNLGIVRFLLVKGRQINILNLFHFSWQSLLFATLYKKINPRGFVYLKMDSSRYSGVYEWERNFGGSPDPVSGSVSVRSLKERIKNWLIRKYFTGNVDLWSVEDDYTNHVYQDQFSFLRGRLITVYNGHTADLPGAEDVRQFNDKEDIIITVGRLGAYQKGTELLLEAFRDIAGTNNFELHLAGPAEPGFEDTMNIYFENNPMLRNRVFLHGNLERDELFRLYNRSRIMCMPSRFEGMALVFPEAMYYRNAVLTTPYVSPAGIIQEFRLGLVTGSAEPSRLADNLMMLIRDRSLMREMADNAHDFALKNFNWDNIVRELDSEINRRKSV